MAHKPCCSVQSNRIHPPQSRLQNASLPAGGQSPAFGASSRQEMPMLKHVVLGLLAVVTMAAPAGADLHYTMHTEARQIPTIEPVNPMSGMGADMLTRTMFPDGPSDSNY